jgi:hypothetical protein
VELGEQKITVRLGDAWLELDRNGSVITWRRENGRTGMLELTEAGRLRDPSSPKSGDVGRPHEEEMDMMAEAWARELMHEQ